MAVHAKEIRILVADDYEAWRTQVRHLLQSRPDWHIAGEACDGLDAVKKAAELHPDIVLLDIAMPRLNGIEAAKKIHDCSPESRIIFLTDLAYTEIREAAYTIGAQAYVTKSHAFSELTIAIENATRVH